MTNKTLFHRRNLVLALFMITIFCGNVLSAHANFSTETDLTLSVTTATAGESVELDAYVWAAGTMLIPRGTVFFSDGDFVTFTWSAEVSIAESGPEIGHAIYTWNIPEDWNLEIIRPISARTQLKASAGHGTSHLENMRPFNGVIAISVDEAGCFDIEAQLVSFSALRSYGKAQLQLKKESNKSLPWTRPKRRASEFGR